MTSLPRFSPWASVDRRYRQGDPTGHSRRDRLSPAEIADTSHAVASGSILGGHEASRAEVGPPDARSRDPRGPSPFDRGCSAFRRVDLMPACRLLGTG